MTINCDTYHLVIGLGRSGQSMAKYLLATGKRVVGTDIDPSKTDAAERLNALGIPTQIGFHDQETFDNAAVLVPSPGIPPTLSYIQTAAEKGVPVESELDIFYKANTLPVVAITGTNGKTTTTTLIAEMLDACGYRPFVCGNIGTPLVEMFLTSETYDVVVAEVSSFQMDISRRFKPDVGVLLNISEDHLDRYETFDAYTKAKWRLFENQTGEDTAVVNASLPGFTAFEQNSRATVMGFAPAGCSAGSCHASIYPDHVNILLGNTQCTIPAESIPGLPGSHNRENLAAAVLVGLALKADMTCLQQGAQDFKSLSHRIEFVEQINGIDFYNDSKATNTDAVFRAIQAFENNIILILGGRGKGTDFSQLIPVVNTSVKTIVALGETAVSIVETFSPVCPVLRAENMEDAVQKAFGAATAGDTILLSPACASFDQYENYVARGKDFIAQVNHLKNGVDA